MGRKDRTQDNSIRTKDPPNTRPKQGGKKSEYYLANDATAPEFRAQLNELGLDFREVPSDGNCLFSSVGDQLFGSFTYHRQIREQVVNYIKLHKEEFEPYFDVEKNFENLKTLGTYGGHESIMAVARHFSVYVIVHQLNQKPWLAGVPKLDVPETKMQTYPQLHLAYHNGEHYTSVRVCGDNSSNPARIKIPLTNPTSDVENTKLYRKNKISHTSNASGSNSEIEISNFNPIRTKRSNRSQSDLFSYCPKNLNRTLSKKEKRQIRRRGTITTVHSDCDFIVESISALHM